MTVTELLTDILLAVLSIALALRALTVSHIYQSALFFIAFGLTLALAWTRLSAPDVALAEAAIGAGLLGVLLIDSLRIFSSAGRDMQIAVTGNAGSPDPGASSGHHSGSSVPDLLKKGLLVATGILFASLLITAIVSLPEKAGLTSQAAAQLDRSGVEHPVTAVLLNYRSYDTWLELGVMLLAMLGIFCAGGIAGFSGNVSRRNPEMLVVWLVHLLVPLMILTAGYLLWLGKFEPGGAFQSGVVLGASGIFLHLAGLSLPGKLPGWLWKSGLVIGFGLFLIYGIFSLISGRLFLEYPPHWSGDIILILETAAALSIGFTITCYFTYMTETGRNTNE